MPYFDFLFLKKKRVAYSFPFFCVSVCVCGGGGHIKSELAAERCGFLKGKFAANGIAILLGLIEEAALESQKRFTVTHPCGFSWTF